MAKQKINKTKPKSNCFTEQQNKEWEKFNEVRTIRITDEQILFICKLYSDIFKLPYWEPVSLYSSGTLRSVTTMIDRLDLIYNTYENEV